MLKNIFVALFVIFFIVVAFERNSQGQVSDTTPPTGSLSINDGSTATNNLTVSLTLTASDTESGVSQMQISNDNSTWPTPEPFSTSKSWTLEPGDGQKTVYIKFSDNAGNWSPVYNSTIILDTAAPAVAITSPSAYATRENQPLLTYTVTDATAISAVTVTVDGAAVATRTGDNLSLLSDGTHTVTVGAIDSAGNSGTSTVLFSVNSASPFAISGVNISRSTINTSQFESATIYYSLNSHATTTLKIIPEKQGIGGAPISTAARISPGAGLYSISWDGTDSGTGKAVPDEAYLYKLEASDGVSTVIYSGTTPTRQGTVSCSLSSGNYNATKNIPATVNYTVSTQATRITVRVSAAGGLNYKLLDAAPREAGASSSIEWDVHKDNGQPWTLGGVSSYCTVSTALRENHIITTGDAPEVTLLTTDPYVFNMAYGQFTRIRYTVSRDADISMTLSPPFAQSTDNGILLWSGNAAAGTVNEYEWRGFDPADNTAKKFIVSDEGLYTLMIQATNPETGSTRSRRGCVRIQY